jgi:RNA polymerase sigma-70 factor (ECF subfamily)
VVVDNGSNEFDYLSLITDAQLGGQASMERLAELVKGDLYAYIYRLTLDYHLAEDLSQETLLEMIQSQKRLNFEYRNQFWAWLYRTALGKVQLHFRDKSRRRTIQMSMLDKECLLQHASQENNDALTGMIRRELSDAVAEALAKLRLRHRTVLVLRCFQQMPYSEIGNIMDCNELQARALFFRAKRALKRQLARHGFGKGFLLMALALFERMTAPAGAAPASTTVTAASAKVGLTGTILGAAGTKLGAVAAIIVATLTITGIALLNDGKLPNGPNARRGYTSSRVPGPSEIKSIRCISTNAFLDHYYYFPDGIDGPMLVRTDSWDESQQRKRSTILQDGQKNRTYSWDPNLPDRIYKTVCIRNHNTTATSLETWRLPCDPPEVVDFVDLIEGEPSMGRLANIAYNTLDETHFQPTWPLDAPVIDERDAMHKRGWTYFRIEGQINDEQIQGWGQIPFVYVAIREHPPWLRLNVGNRLKIIDSQSGACIVGPDGSVIAAYPAGSFFKGLPRPWMGRHTMDIVRKDAAECEIDFDTQRIDSDKVQITLWELTGYRRARSIYVIALYKDIVETIEFLTSGDAPRKHRGRLRFTYLEDVEQAAPEFTEPSDVAVPLQTQQEPMGISWLMELARGALANESKTR